MIGNVGEIVAKSAPVNGVVTTINEQLDAGVDLLEGLLVKKAGMTDAVGLVEGLYAARQPPLKGFPEHDDHGAAHRRGLRTGHPDWRASAGRRRSPSATPRGPRFATSSAAAWLPGSCIPSSVRRGQESLPRSPVIGTNSPVQYPPSQQRGRTTPGEVEVREKGRGRKSPPKASSPPRLGGSDAPREILAEDPQLGSPVLGETTGSDEPATAGGIDPSAGDEADAMIDAGPELPEGVEPDQGRRRSPSSGRHRIGESKSAPTRNRGRDPGADSGPIRVRARNQRGRRDRVAAEARSPERVSSPAGTACCR